MLKIFETYNKKKEEKRKILKEFLKEVGIDVIVEEIKKELIKCGVPKDRLVFSEDRLILTDSIILKLMGAKAATLPFIGIQLDRNEVANFKNMSVSEFEIMRSTVVHELCHYFSGFGLRKFTQQNVLLDEAVTLLLEERIVEKVLGRKNIGHIYYGPVYTMYKLIFQEVVNTLSENSGVDQEIVKNSLVKAYFTNERIFDVESSKILDEKYGAGFATALTKVIKWKAELLYFIKKYPKLLENGAGEYLAGLR